jgi:hypothetical protein
MPERILIATWWLAAAFIAALPTAMEAQVECRVLEEAKAIPAVDALVDSAALVAGMPSADTAGPHEMVFTILTGARPLAYNVDSTVTHTVSAEAAEQLLARIRPGSRSFAPAFRMRVVLGDGARLASLSVEKSVLCPPEMVGQASPINFRVPAAAGSPPPKPRPVTTRLLIAATGRVVRVDIGLGSGSADIDRALRDGLVRNTYRPATLDGRPIDVWLTRDRVEIAR